MGSANRWNRRQWISAAATTMGAAAALPIRGWPSFGGMFGNAAPGPAHEAVDTKLKGFEDHIYGPLGPDEARAIPVPALIGSGDTPDWVDRVKGQTLAFQTAGQAETIDLAPLLPELR